MSKSQVKKSAAPTKNLVLGSNPKDIHGYKKIDSSLLPSIAMAHGAHAMMDGARKYGPYNWRDNAVLARVYIAAAIRHINMWAAGEELADDSSVHHLGHAIACCAILLDAQATGNLIDDRAKSMALIKVMKDLDAIVKAQAETRAASVTAALNGNAGTIRTGTGGKAP